MSSDEERIAKIVGKYWGVTSDKITRETRFIEDLGADSLATIEFIMELEEEFGIEIPQEMADNIRTIGAAIDLIENQKAQAPK